MTYGRLTGLRDIAPDIAELRRTAIAALTGRTMGGAVLVASVAAQPDLRGGWLRCTNQASFALDRLDSATAGLRIGDGLDAAALLDRAEPLLRVIEDALGIELDPADLIDAPSADAVILALSVVRDGAVVHAMRLALPASLALLPAPPEFAPELLGRVVLAATIRVEGPRLAPNDAATLGAGDCILLGQGPLSATLNLRDLPVIPGTLDPANRRFVCR